ncbi:zinc-finger domain-containing protein [Paenibacillus sp. FSL R7-0128]|uniref:zinc-finger domain-containing protein n=1 Tax=Paenibacillus sp. FSL R7-0128 TaxID=2954529 RepID=UPI0030FB20EB
MSRKETLQDMDRLLEACKVCPKRVDKKWAQPSYNRLQKHCNTKCATGKKLLKIAVTLDKEVRARRKQKKGVSA